jgi:putative salt-induced outer membrane protein YdiY
MSLRLGMGPGLREDERREEDKRGLKLGRTAL